MVVLLASRQLTRVINQSQNAIYAEKIQGIWSMLYGSERLLQKTGLVEAYAKEIKDSAVKELRQIYYQNAATVCPPNAM
jgi:hypothetical protein